MDYERLTWIKLKVIYCTEYRVENMHMVKRGRGRPVKLIKFQEPQESTAAIQSR